MIYPLHGAFLFLMESKNALYLFVVAQFRTRNQFPLSPKLLYLLVFSHVVTQNRCPLLRNML